MSIYHLNLPFKGANLELERCPHCHVDRPFIGQNGNPFQTTNHTGKHGRFWKAYHCHRCGGAILAGANDQNAPIIEIYPFTSQELDPISVPAKAREYFKQAQSSIHAPAGAVILAGSAVDAMLKGKGYKDGSLYARIKKAAADHLITEGMAEWAHQVRLDANDQRHADDSAELPDENDARRSIEFARALAQFLFILPAMVAKGIEESKEPKKT